MTGSHDQSHEPSSAFCSALLVMLAILRPDGGAFEACSSPSVSCSVLCSTVKSRYAVSPRLSAPFAVPLVFGMRVGFRQEFEKGRSAKDDAKYLSLGIGIQKRKVYQIAIRELYRAFKVRGRSLSSCRNHDRLFCPANQLQRVLQEGDWACISSLLDLRAAHGIWRERYRGR